MAWRNQWRQWRRRNQNGGSVMAKWRKWKNEIGVISINQ
jgi:hypothetical protein